MCSNLAQDIRPEQRAGRRGRQASRLRRPLDRLVLERRVTSADVYAERKARPQVRPVSIH